MKITRILMIMLALVLVLSLFACGGNDAAETTGENDNATTEEKNNETTEPGSPVDTETDSEAVVETDGNAPAETEKAECEHVAGTPDPEDECNIKCTKCGEVLQKKKHTKGEADPEDSCNIKCTVCNKVLAANKHGEIVVNDSCQPACSVCGDAVSDEYQHVAPAEDAWTLDAEKPQSESATCTRCNSKIYRDATKTINGLTIFTPDLLAAATPNARITLEAMTDEETGIRYCRATVTQAGEGTIVLNTGAEALKGVGKYVAILARRDGAPSSGIDIWINAAGASDHNGAKTVTMPISNDNTWQMLIFDFSTASQVNKDNGIGWTRIDMNPTTEVGDTLDIAYVAFFDSVDEAGEYYGAYLKAYLGADNCVHTVDNTWKSIGDGKIAMTCTACKNDANVMVCTHFDLAKLSNVTAKATTNTCYYTADCALCGGTQVDVPSLTREQGKVYMASELHALAVIQASLGLENNASYARYSVEYVTDDGTLPYTRFTSKIAHENCLLLNDGKTAALGMNNYLAILYKKVGTSEKFELLITPAGTTTATNFANRDVVTENDGTWKLAIIDLSETGKVDTENGAGWLRLDVLNPPVSVGDYVDIAYMGFFGSRENAYEHYLAYLNEYLGKDSCDHQFVNEWSGTGEAGKKQNVCSVCNENIVVECDHASDGSWVETENEGEIKCTCTICGGDFIKTCEHESRTYPEGSSMFDYAFTCNYCGFVVNESGMNRQDGLAIMDAEDIFAITGENTAHPTNGSYSSTLVTDEATGMKYVHNVLDAANTGELYLYFNKAANGVIEKTGDYFVIFYRQSSATNKNAECFISAGDALAAANGNNQALTAGGWSYVIYNYASSTGWNSEDGAGAIRFDIFNYKLPAGSYVDIAYAGFFSSADTAKEFAAEFKTEYGI